MYERKEISTERLSAGLFRTAYILDSVRDDPDTLIELYILCVVALERSGFDTDAILCCLDPKSIDRADRIMSAIDGKGYETWGAYSDCSLLMDGLNELLNLQFSRSERLEKTKFLDDMASLASTS